MNKIHLFISLGILILIVAIIFFYLSFFQKKKQLGKNEAYEKGYGYYSEEISLGCKTTTCGELGTETFVQNCIINDRTGKYCINKDGVYSSESVKRTQPCRIQCYGSQLASYTGYEVENTKSIGLDNKITEYNTIKGTSESLYIVDKNKGLDYTDYFLNKSGNSPDIVYTMKKNCIPQKFVGYNKNTIHCVSNGTNGTNECNLNCSNYNSANTLRMTGNIFENYPEEDNINGTGKIKVCYDINNFNQLEILNSSNEIPSSFVYPDICYKHSIYNPVESGLSLWPDKDSKNSFTITSNFTSKSKYFSFTGASITRFSEGVEKIINPTYNIQKDTNFYTKVMLNSEITLMDKVIGLGTCYLQNDSLNQNYFYMKGSSLTINPGISGISGYIGPDTLPAITSGTSYYYPFLKDNTNNLNPIHDESKTDRKFYYFNTGVSEYIYFKNSSYISNPASNTDTLFIDSDNFNGVPFRLNKSLSSTEDDQFIQIKTQYGLSLPKSRNTNIFLEFKDLYHNVNSYMPHEILFTKNCFLNKSLSGGSTTLGNYSQEKNLFEIKRPLIKEYGVNFYIYGTKIGSIDNPYYYYPLGICSGVIPSDGTSITFREFPGVSFYHNEDLKIDKYSVDTSYIDFSEYSGFATGKVNFRTTVGGSLYPSNIEILSGGTCYEINQKCSLYNTLTENNYFTTSYETNIGICITSVVSESILNIKLLRNNSIGVVQNIDFENYDEKKDYKEKKLDQYYSMLSDQISTGQNLENNSRIVIYPQMSLSKVCDFSIFKSPYTIEDNGKKNYICFDENNNKLNNKTFQVSNKNSKIINNETVVLSEEISNYKGCCYNALGVSSGDYLIKPSQERRKTGINLDKECYLFDDGDYKTIGNFLEPCLQSKKVQYLNSEDKGLTPFFTREIEEDKKYSNDEDLFTNYEEKDYYLNSSSGLKERTKFFQNSTNVYLGQLFTEVFDDSYKENGSFNLAPGICESIYEDTNYTNNYKKQITYEVTKPGMLPMSPSDIALDYFSGHYLENIGTDPASDLTLTNIKKIYSNTLERSSNYLKGKLDPGVCSYGNWINLKINSDSKTILSPQQILFGIPRYSVGPPEVRTFQSRLYDNNLENSFNNIMIGDYISPDFTYFNKFFIPIFENGTDLELIQDKLISATTISENIFYSDDVKGLEKDHYVLFVKSPLKDSFTGLCYPTLEMGKVTNILGGTSIYMDRNTGGVSKSFLVDVSSGLSLFDLGKNNTNIDNSIINNYYKITEIGISTGDNKKYIEFDFQIPSLTHTQGSSSLIGPSVKSGTAIDNNLGNFIKKLTQTNVDYQDIDESKKFNKYTTALSCKFIKNKITFPSNNNAVIFSNYENPKLTTKLTSYVTCIKQGEDGNYYINEFRENLNLLDKQERLTFKEGDTINYYTNKPFDYSESDTDTINPAAVYNPTYSNIATFKVINTNYCMSAGVSSFELYDYYCSLVSEDDTFNPLNHHISEGGTCPTYKKYISDTLHSIPYNRYNSPHIETLGGISSFYHQTGLSAVFSETGNSFSIVGTSIFFDYYKINDLPFNDFSTSFPYQSFLLRGGKLDVLELSSTTLNNENNNPLVLENLNTIGKPYGSTFLLSTPENPSTRVNYRSHGKLNNFNISQLSNPDPGLYSSENGLQVRVFKENYESPELTFKSIENYKPITNSESNFSESNNLNFTNLNTPQYFKNIGGTSEKFDEGVSLSSWEVVPETLYPSQNFITAIVGNRYYLGDKIVNRITDLVYNVKTSSIVLEDNWWNNTGTSIVPVIYNNSLSSLNDSFYTFDNKDGLTGFLKDSNNIQKASNLNNQNLPILIKNYTNEIGDCPVDATYIPVNYGASIRSSFIKNTDFEPVSKIFEDNFTVGNFGKNKILSLGFTPVDKNKADKVNINFLQDNFERNNNISQYIYSIDTTLGASSYDKPFCTEDNFNIGGLSNNINKFDFSNGLLFNLLPNDLESQDYIPYEGVGTSEGVSVIKFGENNFPIYNNYFPGICAGVQIPVNASISGAGVCILNSSGISSPANFVSNFVKIIENSSSSTIKEGNTYYLQKFNSIDEPEYYFKIEELGYNIFSKDCMTGLSILKNSNTDFKYGDYWYIEDNNNNISTFGYLAPDKGSCISHESFIQLKNLINPLGKNDEIKIISAGGSVTGLNSFLNKTGERLNIKKYTISERPVELPPTAIQNLYSCLLDFRDRSSFNIYLKTYTDSTGKSLFLKYNEAIIGDYVETINESDKLYLPITTDFYKYIKCKAVCLFGSNYFGRTKYSMDEEEKIVSMDGSSYNPLIFEPFEIDTFLNSNIKDTSILATGLSVKTVNNIQDTFLVSTDIDEKINFRANPFTRSIKNNYNNFVPNSLNSDTEYKKLAIIDSQSTDVLITKEMSGVSFTQTGLSAFNVAEFNEFYTSGLCVPGQTDLSLQFSEIRQNSKTYFQEKNNDCSIYFDKDLIKPTNLGGNLTFSYEKDKFTIDPVSSNMINMSGTSLTIGKNLEYIIYSKGKKVVFSKDGINIFKKSEEFIQGTSSLQIDFYSDINYTSKIDYNKYLTSDYSATIKLQFRENFGISTPYTIYYGLDNSDSFNNMGGVSIIKNKI